MDRLLPPLRYKRLTHLFLCAGGWLRLFRLVFPFPPALVLFNRSLCLNRTPTGRCGYAVHSFSGGLFGNIHSGSVRIFMTLLRLLFPEHSRTHGILFSFGQNRPSGLAPFA